MAVTVGGVGPVVIRLPVPYRHGHAVDGEVSRSTDGPLAKAMTRGE